MQAALKVANKIAGAWKVRAEAEHTPFEVPHNQDRMIELLPFAVINWQAQVLFRRMLIRRSATRAMPCALLPIERATR